MFLQTLVEATADQPAPPQPANPNWPSRTGKPSGPGRGNNPPGKKLTPNITLTHKVECTCVDSQGKRKRWYRSLSEANESCKTAYAERHVMLRVYECPYSRGWHLTSGHKF